jgi:hypothetical protein
MAGRTRPNNRTKRKARQTPLVSDVQPPGERGTYSIQALLTFANRGWTVIADGSSPRLLLVASMSVAPITKTLLPLSVPAANGDLLWWNKYCDVLIEGDDELIKEFDSGVIDYAYAVVRSGLAALVKRRSDAVLHKTPANFFNALTPESVSSLGLVYRTVNEPLTAAGMIVATIEGALQRLRMSPRVHDLAVCAWAPCSRYFLRNDDREIYHSAKCRAKACAATRGPHAADAMRRSRAVCQKRADRETVRQWRAKYKPRAADPLPSVRAMRAELQDDKALPRKTTPTRQNKK